MRSRLGFLILALALISTLGVAPASAADPTVSITGRSYSVAGKSLAFRVTASNGNNQPLSLVIDPSTGPASEPYYLSENTNEFSDVYRFTLTVNTTITARLGDTTDSVSVTVRPLIGTRVVTRHGKSGRYALLPRGSEPFFRSAMAPKLPVKRCLRHQVQRYRNGAWRTVVTTGCRTTNAESQVGWRWRGSHPRYVNFRIRATFPGDAYNGRGPGRWTYFRFR